MLGRVTRTGAVETQKMLLENVDSRRETARDVLEEGEREGEVVAVAKESLCRPRLKRGFELASVVLPSAKYGGRRRPIIVGRRSERSWGSRSAGAAHNEP